MDEWLQIGHHSLSLSSEMQDCDHHHHHQWKFTCIMTTAAPSAVYMVDHGENIIYIKRFLKRHQE
jgi:hypothetical protein